MPSSSHEPSSDSQQVQPSATKKSDSHKARRTALLGAVFLMATSAIGPGFLTQTATFTAKLGAAFAFAILISVLLDIVIQLNVWRVIAISGRRAQEARKLGAARARLGDVGAHRHRWHCI